MAPATSPSRSAAKRNIGFSRRTQALHPQPPKSVPFVQRYRSIEDIMAIAPYAVVEKEDYSDLSCEQCRSGERPEELMLCDKCDKGFHMKCVRPIVVRVPIGSWVCPKCTGEKKKNKRMKRFSQRKLIDFFGLQRSDDDGGRGLAPAPSREAKKRRRRPAPLVLQKKKRRLLPFVPSENPAQRMRQMASLASALSELQMEFSDDLTYMPGMAPRSANQSDFENGGMQNLTKEDLETVEQCRAMSKRGECAPFVIVYDACEGYTVVADGPIKDLTFIAEYTGDVDYLKHRERDDGDSMMTLLLTSDPFKSLVICADKRGNIARFINGINNHSLESRKKRNCKCLRYNVNGECRVFLVATRDIAKGERLYYDYNGYENEYPTENFV